MSHDSYFLRIIYGSFIGLFCDVNGQHLLPNTRNHRVKEGDDDED